MGVFCSTCKDVCCSSPEEGLTMVRNRILGNRSTSRDYRRVDEDRTRSIMSCIVPRANEEKKESPILAMPPSLEDEKEFMRTSFRKLIEKQMTDPNECYICMEGFTEENPEVKALCSCGVNKNIFHLRCLLRWQATSGRRTCPVCETALYYEGDDLTLGDI